MRRALFVLAAILVNRRSGASETSDADFWRKQEIVYQLLWETRESPKNHPEIYERIKNYRLEDAVAGCDNQTIGKSFESRLKSGTLLGRGQLFSDYREEQVEEVRSLAEALRCAKSFDEFASLAAWSGLLVNELSWLYALGVALAQRPDTRYLRVPRLHEILPHYFFNTDVVVRAYRIKAGEIAGIGEQGTIEANYTGQYPAQENDAEYRLSYFQEDVGLSEFYFQLAVSCPFWMPGDDCRIPKSIRGEFYLHVHKMILAKYKLERLCQCLADVESIDWEQPIYTGFYPSMTHPNGLLFPTRQSGAHVPVTKYAHLEEVRHSESRISKSADLGELTSMDIRSRKTSDDPTCFNEFCNAIEGNADSPHPKYYGSLDRTYRRLLGFSVESAKRSVPSALELSLTSLRDPGFYRICKKIVDQALKFKRNFAPYQRDDLAFDSVRIDYLHVDRLATYMKEFESSLNHPRVLDLADARRRDTVKVKVRQLRLTHKPFALQVGLNSERATKAIVRLFLGPARDQHGRRVELEDGLADLHEIDRWIVELKQGSNKLERSSADSVYAADDGQSSEAFWRSLSSGIKSGDGVVRESMAKNVRRALPQRLLLPRGTKSGFPVRVLVCLHPVQQQQQLPDDAVFGSMPLDGRSLGFPFDRRIDSSFKELGGLRNFMVKEVMIYHEDGGDVEKD